MNKVIFLSTIFGVLILGCTKSISTDVGEIANEIKSVHTEIQEITKDTYCTQYSQCQSIPVGKKACGGPSSYQIYSTLIGIKKVKKLEELSKRSQELEMQFNKLMMLGSDCMYNDPPHTVCIRNSCS